MKKQRKKQNIFTESLRETLKSLKKKPHLFILAFFFDLFLIGAFLAIMYLFLPRVFDNIIKINQALSSLNIDLINITEEKITELSAEMIALNQQLQVYYYKILLNIFFIFILSFLAFLFLGFLSYYFIYLMQKEKLKFTKFFQKFSLTSISYLIIFVIIFFIASKIVTKSFGVYIIQFLIMATIYFALTTFSSLNNPIKNIVKITFKANIKRAYIFLPLFLAFLFIIWFLYYITTYISGIPTKLTFSLFFLVVILFICEFYKALLIALTKMIK